MKILRIIAVLKFLEIRGVISVAALTFILIVADQLFISFIVTSQT